MADKNTPADVARRRKRLGLADREVVIATSAKAAEEARLKELKELQAKRKKADTKRKQESTKAGDTSYTPVPFVGFTHSGRTKVTGYRLRTCLIPQFVQKEGEEEVSSASAGRAYKYKLKSVQVAYGYKLQKRKKERSQKGGSKTQERVIAWFTISVPEQATFADVLSWVKTWGKVPAIVRMGQREQLIRKLASSAGAMV